MLVHCSPIKSRKRLGKDVTGTCTTNADIIYTCVSHAGLVNDVTETDCRTKNGGSHGNVFITFKMLNFDKLDLKLTGERKKKLL